MNDLFCKGEVPVFEKQALLENPLDKSDLRRGIRQRWIVL